MMADTVDGSRDYLGRPPGDHNIDYEFGHPCSNLTTMQQAHMLVLHGKVKDAQAGSNRYGAFNNAADGDIAWLTEHESGLLVPIKEEPNAQ